MGSAGGVKFGVKTGIGQQSSMLLADWGGVSTSIQEEEESIDKGIPSAPGAPLIPQQGQNEHPGGYGFSCPFIKEYKSSPKTHDRLAETSDAAYAGDGQGKEKGNTDLGSGMVRQHGKDTASRETEPADTAEDEGRSLQGVPKPSRSKAGKHDEVEADKERVPDQQHEREQNARQDPQPGPYGIEGCHCLGGQGEGPDRAQDVGAHDDGIWSEDVAQAEDEGATSVSQRDEPALEGQLFGRARLLLDRLEGQGGMAHHGDGGCGHLDGREAGHEGGHLLGRGDASGRRDHHHRVDLRQILHLNGERHHGTTRAREGDPAFIRAPRGDQLVS